MLFLNQKGKLSTLLETEVLYGTIRVLPVPRNQLYHVYP